MNLDEKRIHEYIQLYGHILKGLNLSVSETDKSNLYTLIVLLAKLDDVYDTNLQTSRQQTLQEVKGKMLGLIPKNTLKEKVVDSLFAAMADEASGQHHDSLQDYLEASNVTTGVHLIACYLGSVFKISPDIWFSRIVNSFGREVGTIIRLANDYLDINTSQNRHLAEAPQENAILFFQNKATLKCFIAYKYGLHKLRYHAYETVLRWLKFLYNYPSYLKAITCYESVLELGFKAYFVDKNDCRQVATEYPL